MQRNASLDVIRVVAIFLVLWQHASEYYLIGPELALVDRFQSIRMVGKKHADVFQKHPHV